MRYDCLIIGGGIAGLVCGVRLSGRGLRCGVVGAGVSALHFSSGCVDVLGRDPDGEVVREPFEALAGFIAGNPGHPYARVGLDGVRRGMAFLQEELAGEGLVYCDNGEKNHFHVTGMGTLKPTYLSPRGVYNEHIREAFLNKRRVAVVGFSGFRDFYPELAAANLARHPLFAGCEILTGEIELEAFKKSPKNPHEFRSIDIARFFDTETYLYEIAAKIRKIARDSQFVMLPAFIGLKAGNRMLKKLEQMTGHIVYEVPTLPPSILGMRLDSTLKNRLAALGGVYLAGDRVTDGLIEDGHVRFVRTKASGEEEIHADHFVLASGGYFSGGLASRLDRIREPVFGLQVESDPERKDWYREEFLSRQGHPFLTYGVAVDENLNPKDAAGNRVENLFCAGAVLSGYDPVREGSGSGVAVSTGLFAAERILEQTGDKPQALEATHD